MSSNPSATQFIPAVCPSCGGKLMISEKQDKAICSYCGNPFVVNKNSSGPQVTVENYLKLAKDVYDNNNAYNDKGLDEADNYYTKVLELDPENYLAWYGKAEIIEKRITIGTLQTHRLVRADFSLNIPEGIEEFKKVLKDFKRAIEYAPEFRKNDNKRKSKYGNRSDM